MEMIASVWQIKVLFLELNGIIFPKYFQCAVGWIQGCETPGYWGLTVYIIAYCIKQSNKKPSMISHHLDSKVQTNPPLSSSLSHFSPNILCHGQYVCLLSLPAASSWALPYFSPSSPSACSFDTSHFHISAISSFLLFSGVADLSSNSYRICIAILTFCIELLLFVCMLFSYLCFICLFS